jgi:PGF-CTERM protein
LEQPDNGHVSAASFGFGAVVALLALLAAALLAMRRQ